MKFSSDAFREPDFNIRHVCEEHAGQNPYLEVEGRDRYIKVGFPIPGQERLHEWMWVRVNTFDDRFGILNNDPRSVPYVGDGSRVCFEKRGEKFYFVASPVEE